MLPTEAKITNPDDKYIEISCGECVHATRHKVLTELQDRLDDGNVTLWRQFQVIQCQGCLTVSFCDASQFSEDVDVDEYGQQFIPTKRKLFPSRVAGRSLMSEVHLLSPEVHRVYQEAHAALCAELPIMAGLGLRTLVEAVCRDKEMDGRNLQARINALQGAGFITPAGAEILNHLRQMGNAAAHQMKAHTQEEINAAFDVVEYLLQGVYVIPKLAERLPKGSKSAATEANTAAKTNKNKDGRSSWSSKPCQANCFEMK